MSELFDKIVRAVVETGCAEVRIKITRKNTVGDVSMLVAILNRFESVEVLDCKQLQEDSAEDEEWLGDEDEW